MEAYNQCNNLKKHSKIVRHLNNTFFFFSFFLPPTLACSLILIITYVILVIPLWYQTNRTLNSRSPKIALNRIPENRLRRSLPASAPPSRHKSAMNVSTSGGIAGVKMRDPSKMSPRKQRPYSVATSMPSFVSVELDAKRPSRSKSTDRGIRGKENID